MYRLKNGKNERNNKKKKRKINRRPVYEEKKQVVKGVWGKERGNGYELGETEKAEIGERER